MPNLPEYIPRPVDTSRVELDSSLRKLVEYLARNTHEVWAVGRLKGGWKWGPARDDATLRHPSLVPYEALSESEKQVDRDTAMEALKLIVALGYKIQPPAAPSSVLTAGSEKTVGIAQDLTLPDLIALWRAWGQDRCRGEPVAYAAVARRALDLGECLLAYDVLKAALWFFPSDVALRRLQALALARSGAAEAARAILETLRREGQVADPETMALLARCYKDLWEQAADPGSAREWLLLACETYESAAALRPPGAERYWETINAATLAQCLGQAERAQTHAAAARDECLRVLQARPSDKHNGDDYWPLATIGEAWLVLGDLSQAVVYYQAAARSAGRLFGRVSSTRRNVRLLMRHQGLDLAKQDELLSTCLRLPRVAVFSGHMIDRPGRPTPRFPSAIEPAIAAEIRQRLDDLQTGIGYASASCGADILFLEAILQRGGEANIVLPYSIERFIQDSVAIIPGSNWEARFRALLCSNNVRVIMASHDPLRGDETANDYANQYTFGLAGIRAWQMGAELVPLTVWDGMPGDGPGGTCDAVARWRRCGLTPIVVDPVEIQRRERTDGAAPADAGTVNSAPCGVADQLRSQTTTGKSPSPVGDAEHQSRPSSVIGESASPVGGAEHPSRPSTMAGESASLICDAASGDPRPRPENSLPPEPAFLPIDPTAPVGALGRQLVAILFADATGFSKLGEAEVPLFVQHVLGQVGELARSPGHEPLHVSTWGDGLYLVFATLSGAAQFALELRDQMAKTDWKALGFRKNVEMRTALHVGPVYVCTNPVTGRRDYVGTHVSRTARLEPVTPAGQVYASEAFAALAFVEGSAGFRCEYVGQIGMAKDYGVYPTYHVVRRGNATMPGAEEGTEG